jgi:exodeoxyribonuclease-5
MEISPALNRNVLEKLGYGVREIEMTDVIRQAGGSGILHNATSLRRLIAKQQEGYPEFRFDGFDDITLLGGTEIMEAISESYDRYGVGETIVVTRSNKRANRFNAGIREQILWREEQLSTGDLLMVVKNNYFWKDKENRMDFIANGDIARVESLITSEEVHGHMFADVEVTFPDYGNAAMRAKVMVDVIDLDGPSLDREQQRNLYLSVADDYPDAGNRQQVATRIALDPYYNALQVKFAYAVTCHKSQGGQWKSVFLDQGYFNAEMLNLDYLRWLYTAFTRASEHLYLVNLAREFLPG